MACAPDRFAEAFEQVGGVLLTVDEFMAVLKPEFMVRPAAKRLGTFGMAEEVRLLEPGENLFSLLPVREAPEQRRGPGAYFVMPQ